MTVLLALTACGGGESGNTPPTKLGTLAYVETECRGTAKVFVGHQRLRIRQGEREPVTVFETPEVSVPGVGLVCQGVGRLGDVTVSAFAFQSVTVGPDGASVVFEVSDEFSVNPPLPLHLQPDQKGIFWVRADGTGLRQLGPPSRERFFSVTQTRGVLALGGPSFSPDDRTIAFVDKGPDADGQEADQVVTIDVATGMRTQVTRLPPAVPAPGWPVDAPTVFTPLFVDDRTIRFYASANPDGLNPEGKFLLMTIKTDGSGLDVPLPTLVALGGGTIELRFVITGERSQTFIVVKPGKPTNDPPLVGLPQEIREIFVIDEGKNILQLTNFRRVDTTNAFVDVDQEHVYFTASADPLGTNPSGNCQMFSIDRSGDELIEIMLVDRGDLRGVGHRVAWQARHSLGQQGVAWCRRQDLVARQHADHDRVDPARIDLVALQHHGRVTEAGLGALRFGEVDPPDLPAADHRPRARMTALLRRRNARAARSSPGCPACLIARFQAAVAAAGCRRRFKKSRAATASTRLRDIFISWAQASISRNSSSGNETAVFMEQVIPVAPDHPQPARRAGAAMRAMGPLVLMLTLAGCGGGGGGGATAPNELGTLAYVETQCRGTKEGFVERQALRIRQGDREPVTVFETPDVSVPGKGYLCTSLVEGRYGGTSVTREAFQWVAVSPDGSSVVFEVTDEFSAYPPLPLDLPPDQKGIFWVRADGTGLRRLGPPSRQRLFDVVNGSVVDYTSGLPTSFSSDGRTIAFVDKALDVDGHEGDQVVTIDVATGTRTQVTHLPPAVPPAGYSVNAPTAYGPRFVDERTISFYASANPDGLNPEGIYLLMTTRTDGSGLDVPLPIPVALGGSTIELRLVITGDRPQAIGVIVPGKPTNDPPIGGARQEIGEVFVIDEGKNILQLTNFRRQDTWDFLVDATRCL